MPLLMRMVPSPLSVDIRRGAIASLGGILADRRIATEGRLAVAVGPGQAEAVLKEVNLPYSEVFHVEGGSVDAANELAGLLRSGAFEAVAGIGGGKTIDVAKFAATMAGVPMVAVATNLAHDGIASPVSSLSHESGKSSFGVAMPIAVIVDLDFVRSAPDRYLRAGIGDVVSNLSAVSDWELAAREEGELIDGMAAAIARTAAEALLHRSETVASDAMLTTLAEGLVLSGMAMSMAGSSRPASGACHEIVHAVDKLYPGTSNHGELAGLGCLFAFYLRVTQLDEDPQRLTDIRSCLEVHDLPTKPHHVGLTDAQFAHAVRVAPETRPGRFTVLEYLDMSAGQIKVAVEGFLALA